ncbi:MAG: GNAT family N-acetyltransferase [Alphaproteobacteria bacterium]|nr:GNAT family N-acetyltransferase [Alphaproteobacteria bacterium]
MVDPPDDLPAEIVAYTIELGSPAEAGRLRRIERAAGARFREIGMGDIADGDVTPEAILEDRALNGRLILARDGAGQAAGFLIWSPKDAAAYIEEVSVHPDHAGHRLAARLIDRLGDEVRGRYDDLSLTTFRDVPWNAPYYARLGFIERDGGELGPEHGETWRSQAGSLDMSRRLFMTRPVGAARS